MYNNNLKMNATGNLVKDWKLGKTYHVTSIAVHNGNNTVYIDLVCPEFECKGRKGDLIRVEGAPKISVYNGKPSVTIFCDKVTSIYEKTK